MKKKSLMITVRVLKSKIACSSGIAVFKKNFKKPVKLLTLVKKLMKSEGYKRDPIAEEGGYLSWLFPHFLPAPECDKYEEKSESINFLEDMEEQSKKYCALDKWGLKILLKEEKNDKGDNNKVVCRGRFNESKREEYKSDRSTG